MLRFPNSTQAEPLDQCYMKSYIISSLLDNLSVSQFYHLYEQVGYMSGQCSFSVFVPERNKDG